MPSLIDFETGKAKVLTRRSLAEQGWDLAVYATPDADVPVYLVDAHGAYTQIVQATNESLDRLQADIGEDPSLFEGVLALLPKLVKKTRKGQTLCNEELAALAQMSLVYIAGTQTYTSGRAQGRPLSYFVVLYTDPDSGDEMLRPLAVAGAEVRPPDEVAHLAREGLARALAGGHQ